MSDKAERLLSEALALLQAGDPEAALERIDSAIAHAPDLSENYNARGVALRAAGRVEDAVEAYRAAIARAPNNARAHNNLGDALRVLGHNRAALESIEQARKLDPTRTETLRNLALCRHALGDFTEASEAVRAAMQTAPRDHRLLLLLGRIEHDRGGYGEAAGAYRAFLESEPNHVEALTDLGMAYIQLDKDPEALECFKKALEISPNHLPAQFGLRETRNNMIPAWHIPMMNEPKRNLAYREAIRALVKPTDVVLEVGAGAGLLAMMAAEAGAKRVVTCEMVDEVAAEAQGIVARNGFADRVTVVAKHSSKLELGVDLPERADVLISEILANDFVGEGVLPSLADVAQRLLKPNARVIPAKGAMLGVLVGGAEIEYLLGLGDVCGFDVRSFAKLRPWRQAVPQRIQYDALSADTPLLSYDFADLSTLSPADCTVAVPVTSPGLCYGVLQWISIELAPGIHYDNHPQTTDSVWNKTLYAFPEPVAVKPGDTLNVRLWQRGEYLYLTCA